MYNNDIEISGVTPKDMLPKCDKYSFCKEVVETDRCCIPCQKPDMNEICQVFVNVEIVEKKVICTSMGYKVIITGCKNIKVMYSRDDYSSRVHSAHFHIPFTEFILLGKGCKEVRNIESAVEYISVCQSSKRCFYVSTLILLCAKIREHCDLNYENNKCKKYFNECDCDDDLNCGCNDDHYDQCKPVNIDYCDDNLINKNWDEEEYCNNKREKCKYFSCYNEEE